MLLRPRHHHLPSRLPPSICASAVPKYAYNCNGNCWCPNSKDHIVVRFSTGSDVKTSNDAFVKFRKQNMRLYLCIRSYHFTNNAAREIIRIVPVPKTHCSRRFPEHPFNCTLYFLFHLQHISLFYCRSINYPLFFFNVVVRFLTSNLSASLQKNLLSLLEKLKKLSFLLKSWHHLC